MSKYRCEGCAIYCECEIPNECDFTPKVCLVEFKNNEPIWENIEDDNT